MKYCLAYDSTPPSEGAVQMLKFLLTEKDSVLVYICLKAGDPDAHGEEVCKDVITRLRKECKFENIDFASRRADDIDQDLGQFCEASGVEALVMGTRGLGLMKRTIMGSAATYALNHFRGKVLAVAHAPPGCQCNSPSGSANSSPNLVRRSSLGIVVPAALMQQCGLALHTAEHPSHISLPPGTNYLLFLNGSEPSARAVELLAQVLQVADTATLVSMYRTALPGSALQPSVGLGLIATASGGAQQLRSTAEAIISAALGALKKACTPEVVKRVTASVVEVNDMKQGIVDYALAKAEKEGAVCDHLPRTIVIMGGRSMSAASRLLVGSTAHFVLHNSEVPLVVVY